MSPQPLLARPHRDETVPKLPPTLYYRRMSANWYEVYAFPVEGDAPKSLGRWLTTGTPDEIGRYLAAIKA